MPQSLSDFSALAARATKKPIVLVVGAVIGVALGTMSFLAWPKQYVSTARVLFAASGGGLSLPAGLSLGSGSGAPTSSQLNSLLGFGQGKAPSSDIVQAILSSEGASSAVMDKFRLQTALKLPSSRVLALSQLTKKHLTVKKVKSIVIELSFRAPTAALARDCAAEYLRYCDEYTSKNAVTSSRRTRIFIDQKVKENSLQIANIQTRLSAFLNSNGMQVMQAHPEVGGRLLADVAMASFESEAQAAALNAKLESLTSRSTRALEAAQVNLTSPIASADPLVSQLQSNLVRAQLELDSLELTMTTEHPKVKEARLKVQTLTGQLETRLQSATIAASSDDASDLVFAAAAADSANALRDRQMRQYSDTVQEVKRNAHLVVLQKLLESQLESLLRRRELLSTEQTRARIAEEQESLKLEILDPPSLPDRYDWPRRSIWLVGGGLMGLLVAALWNVGQGWPRK